MCDEKNFEKKRKDLLNNWFKQNKDDQFHEKKTKKKCYDC